MRHLSNQCPFTIAPRIDSIAPAAPSRAFTVTGYLFQHADFTADAVQVYIADTLLALAGASPPAAGQYFIASPSQLDIQVPAQYVAGELLPLRIFINGAESAPHWIEVS